MCSVPRQGGAHSRGGDEGSIRVDGRGGADDTRGSLAMRDQVRC
jgi:hypothetical protein